MVRLSNSKYRCLGCRQSKPISEAYRQVGLGRVCSEACLLSHANKPPKPKAKKPSTELTNVERQLVFLRDGRRCRGCGRDTNLHAHHIRYRSEGVDNQIHNLITLCGDCHRTVHSNKRYWKPICLAYIWLVTVEGRRLTLRQVQELVR